jgi:hypothetical protein
MTLCFPKHPDPNKQLLWTKDYLGHLNDFSKQINERIQQSSRVDKDACLLYITCEDYFYYFTQFYGNIYLTWAETVHVQKNDSPEANLIHSIPCLFETNNAMTIKNCFLFPNDEPIKIQHIKQIIEPLYSNIFCCENDPRTIKHVHVPLARAVDQTYVTHVTRNIINEELLQLNEEEDFEM